MGGLRKKFKRKISHGRTQKHTDRRKAMEFGIEKTQGERQLKAQS